MAITRVPFPGQPPLVTPGDPVEICDASGTWHPAQCHSAPRFDDATALSQRVWLTVSVDAGYGPVNWPAEAVRPTPAELNRRADEHTEECR